MLYLMTEPTGEWEGSTFHTLVMDDDGRPNFPGLDQRFEYRLIWVEKHQLWRVDRRIHAEGG